MNHILAYIITILVFFAIGKLIAMYNGPLFKKFIKSKKHKNATDRMVNNYWGNMISVMGIVIVVGVILGIVCIEFFSIAAICILAAYTFHIANATGLSLEDAISYILSGNDKAVKQYYVGTICTVFSLIIMGFIGQYVVGPIVFKETPKTANTEEVIFPETNNPMENKFEDAIKNAFK